MYKTDPSNKQLYYCPSSSLNPFPISKSSLPHPHPILKSYPFSQTHPQTLPPSLDPTAIPMPFSYPQILLASLPPTPPSRHLSPFPFKNSTIIPKLYPFPIPKALPPSPFLYPTPNLHTLLPSPSPNLHPIYTFLLELTQ